ncbi:hypothetical protein HY640_00545 [Candidatus Woesearchaeota archaeon]|nr:hypothetical protein [Candidatus Woesearchaeota archaeon]
MMPDRHIKIVIFFTGFMVMLAALIMSNGIGLYRASKNSTVQAFQPSIRCVSFIYSVEGISYDSSDGVLQFVFRNLHYSDAEVHNVTVLSDAGSIGTVEKFLVRGSDALLRFEDFDVERNFTVFPDGCRLFSKACLISSGECKGYDQGARE